MIINDKSVFWYIILNRLFEFETIIFIFIQSIYLCKIMCQHTSVIFSHTTRVRLAGGNLQLCIYVVVMHWF